MCSLLDQDMKNQEMTSELAIISVAHLPPLKYNSVYNPWLYCPFLCLSSSLLPLGRNPPTPLTFPLRVLWKAQFHEISTWIDMDFLGQHDIWSLGPHSTWFLKIYIVEKKMKILCLLHQLKFPKEKPNLACQAFTGEDPCCAIIWIFKEPSIPVFFIFQN